MLRRLGLVLALCSLTTVAVAGSVYKWMDRDGQVHYTDRPPRSADAKIIAVIQQSTGVAESEAAGTGAGEPDGAADAPAEPTPEATSAAMRKAVEADVARTRAEQCKKAQETYRNYVESYRVYREKDGKREYLNAKELDEARLRARQDVDTYCK